MKVKHLAWSLFSIGVVALSPLVTPVSVRAQTAAVAVFSGTASATVDWVGGSGSFSFTTGAPLGCEDAGSVNGAVVAGGCSVSASGTFVNVVFGTMELEGSATLSNGFVTITSNWIMLCVVGVCLVVPNPTALTGNALPVGVADLSPNPAVPSPPTATPPNFGVATPGFTLVVAEHIAGL